MSSVRITLTKCILFSLICLTIIHKSDSTKYLTERTSKFWKTGIVRFKNDVCTTLEGYCGTCYTSSQCSDIDGIASGSCAGNGIGTCCLIQRTCGQSSSLNNTYFTNTGYPGTFNGATQCTFKIVPCNSDICQARIDFLSFTLAQPDGNGNCIYDSLVVSGAASNVPIICGENTGQHIYVSFNGNATITLTITTTASMDLARSWSFKVTQIGCDCPTLAPAGCLQYYMNLTGTVRSFNYGTGINGNLITLPNNMGVRPGTRQMVNTNYGICVQMQPGYCGIRWSQASDDTSFTVSNNTALVDVTPGLPGVGLRGENCTMDYVVIPNPYYPNGTAANTDRFCGNQFPTVISYSKPFVLTTVTNDNELSDVANRGFALNYAQQACSNMAALLLTSG